MIVVEDHVVEINGKKYVPYDIVIKLINESYISTVDNISSQLTNAMKDYNEGLKNLGLEYDQDSARSTD
tara:strand:- start:244 stop:450 length:207 start_codon:yes stop_codon:yes gene_type:complete